MLLEGLQLPLTTPFYPDGRLNLRKLEQNVAAYSKTPAAGLAVLSEHGEPSALSDEETRQTLRTAIDAAAAEKVMLAGVSRDSVMSTLHVTDLAAKLGYDAVLVGRPSLLRGRRPHERKELLTYFHAVADRSAIPMVLFSMGAGSLPLDVITELARHPQIIGLVDGGAVSDRIGLLRAETAGVKREVTVTSHFAAVTGRMLAQHEPDGGGAMLSAKMLSGAGTAVAVTPSVSALRTRTKAVGFQMLTGSTAGMLDGLLAGAVGAMSAFAACAPQACYEVFAAWKDGDRGLAEEKQARLQPVADSIEDGLGVCGIKYGCDLNGYFGGLPRLPLLPPSGAEREEMEMLMQGIRS